MLMFTGMGRIPSSAIILDVGLATGSVEWLWVCQELEAQVGKVEDHSWRQVLYWQRPAPDAKGKLRAGFHAELLPIPMGNVEVRREYIFITFAERERGNFDGK